jgi:hypothetical protein
MPQDRRGARLRAAGLVGLVGGEVSTPWGSRPHYQFLGVRSM